MLFTLVAAGRSSNESVARLVDPTHVLFQPPLLSSQSRPINHVLVFAELPPGTTGFLPSPDKVAAVYVQVTNETGSEVLMPWTLLGALADTKPSAIFKLSGAAQPWSKSSVGAMAGAMDIDSTEFSMDMNGGVPTTVAVHIGISLEPANIIQEQLAQKRITTNSSNAITMASNNSTIGIVGLASGIVGKVAEHLFNYVGSYARTQSEIQMTPGASSTSWIPLKAVNEWIRSITTKLNGPDAESFVKHLTSSDP